MTVVDASVLVAILQSEPEALHFTRFLETNEVCIPARVLVEAGILAFRRGLGRDLGRLLADLEADVIALDGSIASAATDAFRRYGKGRHKAALNFGDCLVYATAKRLNLPLLYKGQDFIHTDIKSARSVSH
ncbi:MAG: type II toxin-antitoxin system VapC family toxin [Bryobacteraceae bacterium]